MSRTSTSLSLAILALLMQTPLAAAEPSITDISTALAAAESQYSDISFRYRFDATSGDSSGHRLIFVGIYKQRTSDGRRLYERTLHSLDPATSVRTHIDSSVRAFDGQATVWLDRDLDARGRTTASINPGMDPLAFQDETPHRRIWHYGATSFSKLLTHRESDFKVVPDDPSSPQQPLIQVEGTALSGKLGFRIWIDRVHGYLPVRVRVYRSGFAGPYSETVLSDLGQASKSLWYPKTVRLGGSAADALGDKGSSLTATYHITEMSFDPIPDEAFRLRLPANTLVTDNVAGSVYILKAPTDGVGNAKLKPIDPKQAD